MKHRRRSAFTLIEVLVIIAIILVLLSILLPSVGRAWREGVRARMALDMQTIAIGLDAYRQDHRDIPRVDYQGNGAYTLCRCLVAPEGVAVDGQDGPGFRTRAAIKDASGNLVQQGKVWGPYLKPENWKFNSNQTNILDRYNNPIFYYPAFKGANINNAGGYVGESTAYGFVTDPNRPYFNANDNDKTLMPTAALRSVLGADVAGGQALNPAYLGDYLVWSAGPDERYGPKDKTKPMSSRNRCDDVANFQRGQY